MANSSTDLTILKQRLSVLLDDLRTSDSVTSWKEVEDISQTLANFLRTTDGPVDNHTILGATTLPQTVTSLLKLALHGSSIPEDRYTSAVFELLRVAANLCMDHDDNRGRLLEAQLPQAIISLLEGYADNIPEPPHVKPFDLSISHLKVLKSSIGALLNASIGYDAVQRRLISLEAPQTILKLSTAIYPTGYWSKVSASNVELVFENDDEWALRITLSDWAWRAISEIKNINDDTLQTITPDSLPLLVQPLSAFLAGDSSPSRPLSDRQSAFSLQLIDADLEDLVDSCMLVESLALDVEDIRLSLARGLHFPAEHNGIPCLSIILDFIENGTYPASWSVLEEERRKSKEKVFNTCKAALIKSVVEVAGEEKNQDVLWDDSEPEKPGGHFVYRMVDWLKRYVHDSDVTTPEPAPSPQSISDREDMVICASLSLGNLARREKNSRIFVSSPYSLAPILTSEHVLSRSTDIKVKHGILALLKHLAQAPASSIIIQNALGEAGVVRRIAASGVWDEHGDAMADVVQLSAIGVVKHMASANVEHAYALVLPSSRSPNSPTGLSQILALVKRTDSVPIKSEGSRVLVNVVRALWGNKFVDSPTSEVQSHIASGAVDQAILEKQRKRNAAIRIILSPESASVLTKLVGGSGKYPLLVNEGLIALTMFSIPKEGASLVLDALTVSLGLDLPAETSDALISPPTTASDLGSPMSATPATTRVRLNIPRHPLDMLIFTLKNVDNPVNFPVEVRANVCSFLIQLSKNTNGDRIEQVKDVIRPALDTLLVSQGLDEKLEIMIRRLLDAWS